MAIPEHRQRSELQSDVRRLQLDLDYLARKVTAGVEQEFKMVMELFSEIGSVRERVRLLETQIKELGTQIKEIKEGLHVHGSVHK
jgi:peptidoglycan hydrolase CwlO-like protein